MAYKRKPYIQEILSEFMDATISLDRLFSIDRPIVFTPSSDLIFNTDEKTFYLYNRGYYQPLSQADMHLIFNTYLMETNAPFDLTTGKLNDFVSVLELRSNKHYFTQRDEEFIAFNDQLVSLSSFRLQQFDKSKIALIRFPFPASELVSTPTPSFDAYLKSTFPNDPQLQQFIPTLIATYLLPPHLIQSAFFLVGDGANGKSVFLDLLSNIFTDQYTSSFTLKSLTQDRFTTSELIGKKINIVNEDESKFLEGERFKALVTGDKIQAERKFGTPFSFRPSCKFIFASNDIPTFKGMNHGLKRRLHIVPFKVTFKEHEQDKQLTHKLSLELPGIIGKAIEAASALKKNNYILDLPISMQEAKQEFIESSLPSVVFFRECVKIGAMETDQPTIYSAYRNWAHENGHSPSSARKFWDEVKANVPGLLTHRSSGKRIINGTLSSSGGNVDRLQEPAF